MWRGLREIGISLQILLISPDFWRRGFPSLIAALFFSLWSEIYFIGSRYNTIILLASLVSSTINVGKNSTRQYFILLFLILVSILLDFKSFLSETNSSITPFRRLVFYGINISKGFAIRNILYYSPTAIRVRKYLHRRLRIFFVPCSRPRKLRREIISRILAIGYLQLISTILYLALTIAALSAIWFSNLMTRPPAGYLPLAAFYPIKVLTSTLVLYGISTDTDPILALSYFGLVTCWSTRFVREYISRKRVEYGGYPIPYGLNPYRVYVIAFLKLVDFLWGVGGWCTIGTTFGKRFFSLNTNLMGVILATAVTLILSDIWIPILFAVVLESLAHRAALMKTKRYRAESDDSELEELELIEKGGASAPASSKSRPLQRAFEEETIQTDDPYTQQTKEEASRATRSILRKPKPFEPTSSVSSSSQRKAGLGLTEIHASQFSTSRRSSR